MSQSSEAVKAETSKTAMQKILDAVERVGNSVPHPVVIFLILIAVVMVLSHILYLLGANVSYQVINPDTDKVETAKTVANSLLTVDGIRHIYTRLVPNFLGFSAVGLLIVAMIGVGVAEEAGLVNALIRKLVVVSPHWALIYILAFVGILSSIASDAGYLVLIPLAGTAFLSVGRNPLAGLALGFAGVASAFNVNMIVKPLDAVLTEITNDAIHMVNPNISIDLTANLLFSMASVLLSDGHHRRCHRTDHRASVGQISGWAIHRRSTGPRGCAAFRTGDARVAVCRPLGCSGFWSSSVC